MEVDHEKLGRELIRALRGPRSQVAFSRRLGYATNTLYSWEAGRRWPTASKFLWAAERSGLDVPAAICAFYRREPTWLATVSPTEPEGVAVMLRDLRGQTPIQRIAERTGRSRFAVSRWLSGSSEPRLPDLLRLIEAMSLRLLDFVALFADPAELDATSESWRRLLATRELAWSAPWAQAVLLALELAPYQALARHDDAWLASRLHLDEQAVNQALSHLLAAGRVTFNGTHYAPEQVQQIDLRRAGSSRNALKRYWAGVALARLEDEDEDGGLFSYNLFTVSAADLERLAELQRAHYRAVRALLADSSPAEHVALMNLQLLRLDR